MKKQVKPGADYLLNSSELKKGETVGLICNPTSIMSDYTHLADVLVDSNMLDLKVIFGPEHGFFSTAQDMIDVGAGNYRGIEVLSLYGEEELSLLPPEDVVAGLDAVVFDIQDVGSRYYTYVWTMTGAIEICARAGTRMVVCDRPNPINGMDVQGPILDMSFQSFIGRHSITTRHGMTAGEIASMYNDENELGCDLSVIKCQGWARDMWFDDTRLPWVMPSPNMPTLDTATVYPGGCLIEGTNLSEGRGTTRPFEIVGAPFIDGNDLAGKLNALGLAGVYFRPVSFEPTFQKFAGVMCQGVFVHVIDRLFFRPVECYLALISLVRDIYPERFAWRTEKYEFVDDIPAIDLLFGSDKVRLAIESGIGFRDIASGWTDGIERFKDRRAKYLLY